MATPGPNLKVDPGRTSPSPSTCGSSWTAASLRGRADGLPHAPPARRGRGACRGRAPPGRPTAATSRRRGSAATPPGPGPRAVSEIAITEHVYRFAQARDWSEDPWWREEATEDADAYCAAVLAAGASGLPVLLGIEMDWLSHRRAEIAAFLDGPALRRRARVGALDRRPGDRRPRRRRLGRAPGRGGVVGATWPSWSRRPSRGSSTCSPTPTCPRCSAAASPSRFSTPWTRPSRRSRRPGMAVECSSAGLRKPVGELYPEPALLARFRRRGSPATLSSDAHRARGRGARLRHGRGRPPGRGLRDHHALLAARATQVPIRWR